MDPQQYGIAVQNRFALSIDDDDDPLEILRLKEEEAKTVSKADKKKTKAVKKSAAVDSRPKEQEQQVTKKDGEFQVLDEMHSFDFLIFSLYTITRTIPACKRRHFVPCGQELSQSLLCHDSKDIAWYSLGGVVSQIEWKRASSYHSVFTCNLAESTSYVLIKTLEQAHGQGQGQTEHYTRLRLYQTWIETKVVFWYKC